MRWHQWAVDVDGERAAGPCLINKEPSRSVRVVNLSRDGALRSCEPFAFMSFPLAAEQFRRKLAFSQVPFHRDAHNLPNLA